MLSSLDITRILSEAENYFIGGKVIGLEYYRKERAVQLYTRLKKNYCITLSFHPVRSGFYILPAAKSRLNIPEKYRPFAPEVWSGIIEQVSQFNNDRIIEFKITKDQATFFVIFEILGPNANVLQLDDMRRIMSSLRKKSFNPDQAYQPPKLPEKLDPLEMSVEIFHQLVKSHPQTNFYRLLEKHIYGFDYYMAQAVTANIPDAENPEDHLNTIHDNIRELVSRYRAADSSIYVYRIQNRSAFYPLKLPGHNPLDKFKSLSEAQKTYLERLQDDLEDTEQREKTLKSIHNKIRKAERLTKKIEADLKEAANYEQYRQWGDLLKVNLAKLKRGMTSITVDNLYSQGESIEIKLDPKLSGQGNIEQYSRRYRKGREGLSILKRRLSNTKLELENLQKVLKDFDSNFERASQHYPELLLSPVAATFVKSVQPFPYKEYQTSTGLTILVGKSGDNNDRTTFEYARPYELWFHTSQCPGSHVVLKYPNKNFEPSKREIEETAAAAAYFSKARSSAKVPVNYTLKKYVRKARKAKPGLVLIEREKTIIVEPLEPVKKKE